WQNEAIPTLHPPAARIFQVDRNDPRARLLSQKNDSLSEFVSRPARAVRCNNDVPSTGDHVRQLPDGAGALTRAGTPNDFEIETLDQAGEERAVAAPADQGGAAPFREIAFDHERQEEKAIVPECADVAFVRWSADDAGAIVD